MLAFFQTTIYNIVPRTCSDKIHEYSYYLFWNLITCDNKLILSIFQIGINDGPIYITNGLFFLASFLLCRVLSTPLMFLRYAYYKDIPWAMVPFRIPVKCTLSCFLFFLLQFYWFLRICHRMRRHIIGNVRKKV